MSVFDDVFTAVAYLEGGFQDNPSDSGSWSGGKIGVGELRGTKYGVSAAAHPNLDIRNLTLDQAKVIFRDEYWDRINGDELPPSVALVVADAAYNSGPGNAVRWMQQAVRASVDGVMGPRTLEAVRTADPTAFCVEFLALRLIFLAGLASWHTFSGGWSRRIVGLPFKAMTIGDVPTIKPLPVPPSSPPVPIVVPPSVPVETVTADELNAAELSRLRHLELEHD